MYHTRTSDSLLLALITNFGIDTNHLWITAIAVEECKKQQILFSDLSEIDVKSVSRF